MRAFTGTGALALLAISLYGGPALACACCSNEGQRYVRMETIDSSAAGLLSDIRFADAARIYTGEGDLEDIEGISASSSELRLDVSKSETSWQLSFRDGGRGGMLTFPLPASVTRFEVDPREPGAGAGGTGPLLYKEWRLTSKPRGTGMFERVTEGDWQATLVLHGRGNSCTDASQFTAWTLVLHGSKGTTTLFGDLVAR